MIFKKIYIVILFICAALVGAGFGFMTIYEQRQNQYTIDFPEVYAFEPVGKNVYDVLEKYDSGTLYLSGNMQIDQSILKNCYDEQWETFHFESVFSPISSSIYSKNNWIGSFNGTFSSDKVIDDEMGYTGSKRFCAPNDVLMEMRKIGMTHLSMTGNHITDYGLDGIANTRNLILKQQIVPAGIFSLPEEAYEYDEFQIGDIDACLFSATETLSAPLSEKNVACVNYLKTEEDFEKLCSEIKKCKHLGFGVVCVSIYFKNAGKGTVSLHQREMTEQLLDAGADVIVGTNPDIVEPMVVREKKVAGRKSKQFVFFSLGNFLTGGRKQVKGIAENISIVAKLSYYSDSKGVGLEQVSFLPTYCVSYASKKENEEKGSRVGIFSIPSVCLEYDEKNTMEYQTSSENSENNSVENSDNISESNIQVLTKSDISYIRTMKDRIIQRLFSETQYTGTYKDGWFTLK